VPSELRRVQGSLPQSWRWHLFSFEHPSAYFQIGPWREDRKYQPITIARRCACCFNRFERRGGGRLGVESPRPTLGLFAVDRLRYDFSRGPPFRAAPAAARCSRRPGAPRLSSAPSPAWPRPHCRASRRRRAAARSRRGNDIAAGHLVGPPGCGEAAWCHRGGGEPWYGLHLTGVTASGVLLPELTQPAAVSLLGLRRVYGLPRPSVTCRLTSSSRGGALDRFPTITFRRHPHRACPSQSDGGSICRVGRQSKTGADDYQRPSAIPRFGGLFVQVVDRGFLRPLCGHRPPAPANLGGRK
jgi:hypothetical protein